MHRLILLSRCRERIDHIEFERLYALWSKESREMGITGALLACEPYFLQVIEGPAAATRALLEIITHESRHLEVHVVHEEVASSRQFDGWTMTALHLRGADVDFRLARTLLTELRAAVVGNKDLPHAARAMAKGFEQAIVDGYESGAKPIARAA